MTDPAYARLERALEGIEPPFAVLDLDAMWANAGALLDRAGAKPVRLASKSVRCRHVQRAVLDRGAGSHAAGSVAPPPSAARPGFHGIMAFTLAEALWLHGHGFDDVLLGYPQADRAALAALCALDSEAPPVLMIDSVEHLDLVDAAAPPASRRRPVRVCIEFDTSLELARGRIRIGAKRSPLRTPAQVAALARTVLARPGFELAGVMGYEAHVAGIGDRPPNPALGAAIRRMQQAASAQLAERRAAVVAAVREIAPIGLVNGGGTGSLEATATEPAVTELTAGSGLYGPALFDRYTRFRPRPALLFCLHVVRAPGGGIATALGGGYLASGAPGADRLPVAHLPVGLRLTRAEGAGEVQTPLAGRAAAALRPGDRVYLRHAKAGELCERFDVLHLLAGDRIVDAVPTYRGEGKAFL